MPEPKGAMPEFKGAMPGSKGAMPRPSGMAAVVWCQIGLQPIASVRQQLLNQ